MITTHDHASDELDQRDAEQVLVDDDEVMTNNLPMIHTSTERLERLENSHMRLTARVKILEAAFAAQQGD